MQIIPDISFYQYKPEQLVDFNKMKTEVPAVIIRAGQATWEDIRFKQSWQLAKEAKILRGSYWFYDPRYEPKRQAEKWAEVTRDDRGELEFWADFENLQVTGKKYESPKHWYDFMEYCKQIMPNKQFGVYTGYYYWLEVSRPEYSNYFSKYPLWIAQYGNITQPRIPPIWKDWVMWQYTDNGDGNKYGVASKNIDLNFYKGQLLEYTEPQGENKMFRFQYEVTTDGTRLRPEPTTEASIISKHPGGTPVYGNEIFTRVGSKAGVWTDGDQWLKVTQINDQPATGYMAIRHLAKTQGLLRLVKENNVPLPESETSVDLDFDIQIKVDDGDVKEVIVEGEKFIEVANE